MKEVLHAHIEREIKFDTKEALTKYMKGLEEKKRKIIIVSLREADGNHYLRFKEQYNRVPFFPEDHQKEGSHE